MGIKLGSQSTTSPGAKLRAKKDTLVGHVCFVEEIPWTEFGSDGKQKIGTNGKPRTQERITLLVRNGNAVVKDGDAERQVLTGETVTLYFAGHRRWAWAQACKRRDGGYEVGDVVRVEYTHDEPGKAGSPKKCWDVRIRPAKPEEAADVDACEAIYHRLNQAKAAQADDDSDERQGPPPHDGGGWSSEDDDSIPF
jgi:hypothetical protein